MPSSIKVLKFVSIAFLMPNLAWASLGGNVNSISQDAVALSSSSSVKANSQLPIAPKQKTKYAVSSSKVSIYTLYSFTLDGGLNIKQYVNNGQVFAVYWHGPYKPNLSQLLGQYFMVINNTPGTANTLRSKEINTQDLLYRSNGFPGNFSGSAILKNLIPQGLALKDIK